MQSPEATAASTWGEIHVGADVRSSLAAQARICLLYAWRHRRLPNLTAPTRFTELVQLRKLQDRSPYQTNLMDKIAAKRFARKLLGPEWTIPTLWQGTALPDTFPFAKPVIVKARHGCNQYAVLSLIHI